MDAESASENEAPSCRAVLATAYCGGWLGTG